MVHSISLLPRTNKSTTQQQTKTTQNLSVSMFQKREKKIGSSESFVFFFLSCCLVLAVLLLLPVPAFGLLTGHVAKDNHQTEADGGHEHRANAVELVALEHAVVTVLVAVFVAREEAVLHSEVRRQGGAPCERRPGQHRTGLIEPRGGRRRHAARSQV